MSALIEAVALPVLGWWLLSTLIGLAAAPLALRLFPELADRGLSLARPLGIIFTGFFFWIGASLSLFPPNRGAAVLGVALLALGGLAALGGRVQAALQLAWMRDNWQRLLAGEALFAVIFIGWASVRAYAPEIAGTEKPMELLFLNAVLRADAFPPPDPWLAGYTVSYYYFGYVLVGMLAHLAATPASVAFNLALALVMALSAHAAFGLVSSLVIARWPAATPRQTMLAGLLGTVLLVGMGNLVGLLDFARSRGWGTAEFWSALAIDGLTHPYRAASWTPTEHWWWWKATRVINTFRDGQGIDYTINEFPIFSFVLGDLHPHVLALPFNLLVVGIAAAAFHSPYPWGMRWARAHPWQAAALPICVGALGFLNSWDLPTYGGLVVAAVALSAYRKAGHLDRRLIRDVGLFALALGGASLVLYLPFYLSFSSQASGIRPVVQVATQPHHWALFWGPLALPAIAFVGWQLGQLDAGWRRALQPALLIGAALPAAWLLVTLPAAVRTGTAPLVIDSLPAKAAISLPLAAIVTLALLVAFRTPSRPDAFAALLLGTAFLLHLAAEHFFILDVFGNRMNTVFKLYFQAWTLLAVAGGYALVSLWPQTLRQWKRGVIVAACLILIAGGMYYTLAATWSRADGFTGQPTLDGLAFARAAAPGEAEAIDWLAAQASRGAVVVEATGGQYSEFGRVSARTGIPTILGWAGHQRQWRGSDAPFRGRDAEIDRIYTAASRDELLALLKKYNAEYVFVGSLERQKYGAGVGERLASHLDVAFQNGSATIFRAR
ncbi:MAG: DUF2298 domain-containing protein [Dehalococcoidia bacterium]|nr:DUF2298 domain-containing protein [Dehalococcoidia bacterium]